MKNDFDSFVINSLQLAQGDYYSKMSISDFIELKRTISCINNIITLKTTLAFIDFLLDNQIIDEDIRNKMIEGVLATNVNANGFDVEYDQDGTRIIAEVKCNIPVNKHSFGAAQIEGITSDLKGLSEGKTKGPDSVKDFLKFMVMLNYGPVEESMGKIIKLYNPGGEMVITNFDRKDYKGETNHIYVVYIQPGKLGKSI